MRKLTLASAAAVAALGLATIAAPTGAQAADATPANAANVTVNLAAETATAKVDGYVALAKKDGDLKPAEYFEVKRGDTFDISSLPSKKDSWICFCTDVDSTAKTVTATEKIKLAGVSDKYTPEVNYANFDSDAGMFSGVLKGKSVDATADLAKMQIKIGDRGKWDAANTYTTASLRNAVKTGATVYYSYQPNENSRYTQIAKLKIGKQAKAPSVKLDGAKGTVAIKAGIAYKTSADGTLVKVSDKNVKAVSAYVLSNTATGSAIAADTTSGTAIWVCSFDTKNKKPRSKFAKLYLQSTSNVTAMTAKLDVVGDKLATKGSVGITLTATNASKSGYECMLVDNAAEYVGSNPTKDITDTKTNKWISLKDLTKPVTYKSNLKVTEYSGLANKVLLVREKGYTDKSTKKVYMPGKVFKVEFPAAITAEITAR